MNLDKFDSLSDEALYALAEKMGLDLPPNLERVFVVEEILGALEEDSDERLSAGFAPFRIEEFKFSGSSLDSVDAVTAEEPAIERCYNETSMRVLVRDPAWAFAFWEISDADLSALEGLDDSPAFFLHVSEVSDADGGEQKKDFFDIPVSEDDSQWYINLPRSKTKYRIELCARAGNRVRILSRSKDVAAPRQFLDRSLGDIDPASAELFRLAGIETLDIEAPLEENPQRILKYGPEGE